MLDKKRLDSIQRVNQLPINRHCRNLLLKVKADHPEHIFHALNLLQWARLTRRLVIEIEDLADHLDSILMADPDALAEYLDLKGMVQVDDPVEQASLILDELHNAATESMQGYPPKKLATYR